MTIIVDEARWPWRGQCWAHLCSDASVTELHAFAMQLGLRRVAFQGDHYDVTAARRLDAISAGALPVDSRDLVRRLRDAGLLLRSARRAYRWEPVAVIGGDRVIGASWAPWLAQPAREDLVTATSLVATWLGQGPGSSPNAVTVRVLLRPGEVATVVSGPERGTEAPALAHLVQAVHHTVEDGVATAELFVTVET